jgi:hypothetical protein
VWYWHTVKMNSAGQEPRTNQSDFVARACRWDSGAKSRGCCHKLATLYLYGLTANWATCYKMDREQGGCVFWYAGRSRFHIICAAAAQQTSRTTVTAFIERLRPYNVQIFE